MYYMWIKLRNKDIYGQKALRVKFFRYLLFWVEFCWFSPFSWMTRPSRTCRCWFWFTFSIFKAKRNNCCLQWYLPVRLTVAEKLKLVCLFWFLLLKPPFSMLSYEDSRFLCLRFIKSRWPSGPRRRHLCFSSTALGSNLRRHCSNFLIFDWNIHPLWDKYETWPSKSNIFFLCTLLKGISEFGPI